MDLFGEGKGCCLLISNYVERSRMTSAVDVWQINTDKYCLASVSKTLLTYNVSSVLDYAYTLNMPTSYQ